MRATIDVLFCAAVVCGGHLVGQDWRQVSPSRASGAIAWDPVRERLVLFDTNRSTWEWDGNAWAERDPGSETPAQSAELAWDPANLGVLAFGGEQSNQTWLYDGLSWRLLRPSLTPLPRIQHVMATDENRGRVVLFGGADQLGGIGYRDTWEWNGSNWMRVATAGARPRNLSDAGMAYDPIRRRVVLFGGNDQRIAYYGSYWPETWEWDGVAWQQAEASGPAPGRDDPGMAFDPRRGRVLMHGGVVSNYFGTFSRDDTWEWDGTTWHPLADGPSGRNAMAFVPSTGTMLRVANYTWSFDGQAWTPAEIEPDPRSHSAIAFDPVRQRAVMYGRPHGATWEHDGNRWSLASATSTGATPSPFGGPSLAYDGSQPGAGQVLMYDRGLTASWDGSTWRQRTAAGPSGPGTIVADPARAEVLLYTETGETWVWRGGAWAQRLVAGPPPRWGTAMVFDPLRNQVVLFGGTTDGYMFVSSALSDTWRWDGTAWSPASPPVSPAGRYDHAMAWDASTGEIVLSGGQKNSTSIGAATETWSFDGTTWRQRVTSREPLWQLAMTATQPGWILGIESRAVPPVFRLPDSGAIRTWEYDARPAAARSRFGTGCGSATRPPDLDTLGLPRPGRRGFAIDVGLGRPMALGALMLSAAAADVPLGGGCSLYVDPGRGVVLPFVTGPTGAASQTLPIPSAVPLGVALYNQAALLDPGAPFAGIALTRRLMLDIGR